MPVAIANRAQDTNILLLSIIGEPQVRTSPRPVMATRLIVSDRDLKVSFASHSEAAGVDNMIRIDAQVKAISSE